MMIWLRRSTFVLSGMVLGLIALGGATRAMNAGLACPDWPLCFGQYIPDFHPQVYFEFIHRALAGLVALLTVGLTYAFYRNPQVTKPVRHLALGTLAILFVQIIMGGLTVLKLLHFGTVTMHLALGLLFFSCLVWIYLELGTKTRKRSPTASPLSSVFVFVTLVIFGQILLGGLVSSNYAGLACPDWPTCHGQWLVPIQGLVGLQFLHRLGAYSTALVIFGASIFFLNPQEDSRLKNTGKLMSVLILLQILIGIFNVKLGIPAVVTVVHLVVAALLLALSLRVLHLSRQ